MLYDSNKFKLIDLQRLTWLLSHNHQVHATAFLRSAFSDLQIITATVSKPAVAMAATIAAKRCRYRADLMVYSLFARSDIPRVRAGG